MKNRKPLLQKSSAALLTAALLVLTFSGCGNNLGRLYPDNTQSAKDGKSLSERIAEWESFRLPGLRGEDPGSEAANGDETPLTEEELAALEAEEAAAAERHALRYTEVVRNITGEWSELSEALPLFRPIVSWFGPLIIQEDGTYSSDSGTGSWELSTDLTQVILRGSRGKTVLDILTDGNYDKLCASELHLNFLRAGDLEDYIAERFVSIQLTSKNVDAYISRPVNIGIIPDEKDLPTDESAWVLSSPAYRDGLVYYGRSEDFHLRIQNTAGEDRTAILPYDTLSLANGASYGKITQASGTLVYVRSEFVADNRMTDARTRTLTFTDGTTHTTSMTWYSDLADYADWIF